MTIDPEKFGTWTARLFVAAIGVLIVVTLAVQFLVKKNADPIVVATCISLAVVPLAGPAAVRFIRKGGL